MGKGAEGFGCVAGAPALSLIGFAWGEFVRGGLSKYSANLQRQPACRTLTQLKRHGIRSLFPEQTVKHGTRVAIRKGAASGNAKSLHAATADGTHSR